ncbi:LPXTG cell wall anchor domain-containing protein [Streptomyces lincolnensis]|nr:LPXTG cell wall anchor domain-containing protein [Streptomyces lincolnensis]
MLTATAAGTLLGALWFVPSANATGDHPANTAPAAVSTTQARVSPATATQISSTTGDGTQLADTGSFDTTPYVIGGTMFLTLGAGFVVYSVRRERLGF